MNLPRHLTELSRFRCDQLEAAHRYAPQRYDHYRRRMPPDEAYTAALAWGRNATEQRRRDYAHDTGAVAR